MTPLTALALADVLYEAACAEMLSVVTGNPATMGDAMIVDPDCDYHFTGSVRWQTYREMAAIVAWCWSSAARR